LIALDISTECLGEILRFLPKTRAVLDSSLSSIVREYPIVSPISKEHTLKTW
jgi:hypothetical protein